MNLRANLIPVACAAAAVLSLWSAPALAQRAAPPPPAAATPTPEQAPATEQPVAADAPVAAPVSTPAPVGVAPAAPAAPVAPAAPAPRAAPVASPFAPPPPAAMAVHAQPTDPYGRPLDRATVRQALAEERARLQALMRRPRREEEPQQRGDAGAPFAIGVRMSSMWNTDPSYDLFADTDSVLRGGFWLAYDMLSITETTIASAEISFGSDGRDGRLLRAFDTRIENEQLLLAGEVRHAVLPWLQPHVRLGAGVSYTETTIETDDGSDASQEHWAPTALLGIGFTLRTPTRFFETRRGGFAAFSVGLKFEAGYSATPSTTITLADTELAELQRSGPYLEGALVMRF